MTPGLRVGVVGAGLRGRMYARVLRRVAGVEVIGLCDPSARVAREAEAALGLPVMAAHPELLARDLDAVVVATPDFAHAEPAVDAAAAGCHLMIEKPLAMSTEDAQAIADAVEASGRECLVAFENRWNPAFSQLRERIGAGELGRVVFQSAVLNTTRFVPTGMLGWAARTSPLWFQMAHTLDLVTWLAGSPVASVAAVGSRGALADEGVDTWDVVQALVTLEDGSTASLESSWVLPESMPSFADFRFEVVGERGAAFVDQLDQTLRVAGERLTFPRTLALEVAGRPEGFPAWMATQWAEDLLAERPLRPGVEDGLASTRALCAIEESLETGAPVSLGAAR